MSVITLLSDFGTRDSYVAEMKAVLLMRAPAARLVDVSHDVPPGDVQAAAWLLARIWSRFPSGTVHLAVVDPTVGSARRPVAVRAAERWLVGPDNGLVTFLERCEEGPGVGIDEVRLLVASDREQGGSDTFHGRDLFAPAAGALVAGSAGTMLGAPVDPATLIRLDIPRPARLDTGARGVVVHVDRFGTLVTNVPSSWLPGSPVTTVGGRRVRGLARSYADVESGEPLLVVGSAGTLEVSVRDGSAAERFGVRRGASVEVTSAA